MDRKLPLLREVKSSNWAGRKMYHESGHVIRITVQGVALSW
jgi:hypothetical protein